MHSTVRSILSLLVTIVALVGCAHHQPPPVEVANAVKTWDQTVPDLETRLGKAGIDRDQLACNSLNVWAPGLRDEAKLSARGLEELLQSHLEPHAVEGIKEELVDHMMWWMVRALLVTGDTNNLGAIVLNGMEWTDDKGIRHPVTVFRSAFTPNPGDETSCFGSLLEVGHVRHVVNLYDGEMYVDDLEDAERRAAAAAGATYVVTADEDYGRWRDTLRKNPESGPERETALRAVGRLIHDQILAPGGEPPRGNILVHCGGGMHRTGMVMAILDRWVNDASMDRVTEDYRYHVDWQGPERPGGFEADNLEAIDEFRPEYLRDQ